MEPAFPSFCQRKMIKLRRRVKSCLKPQWLQFWDARRDPVSQQANWVVGAHLTQVMERSAGAWACGAASRHRCPLFPVAASWGGAVDHIRKPGKYSMGKRERRKGKGKKNE